MPTKYLDRPIPSISLHDFESRIDEITAQLLHAAETSGFFTLTNHSIPVSSIHAMFALSESFFALPSTTKALVPWSPKNAGWESMSQIRPSTGVADQKESYQLQFGENMDGLWLDDAHFPGFKPGCLGFMSQCQEVSEKLMRCFALGLGFEEGFFVKAHDVSRSEAQSVLRLLHYFAVPQDGVDGEYYRAGPHADWDFLTLLFQREGQSGLEICPGREVVTEFGIGDTWTRIELREGEIVCNIGDLLMSWSDDQFKSTFHRVGTPRGDGGAKRGYWGERYSLAFFNQPCSDVRIQGPRNKYPEVSGREFTENAMRRNFRALKEKREALEREKLMGSV
jgi:isopenicillin N synthase-like dioxygenase